MQIAFVNQPGGTTWKRSFLSAR